MLTRNRWVLLEHLGAPDDSQGRHFDLLLEDFSFCRAWRLNCLPIVNGPYVHISPLPSHGLDWLSTKGREVSGNRGWARPIQKGIFLGSLPTAFEEFFSLELQNTKKAWILELSGNKCFFRSKDYV
tara:strand:+ start:151 stop:528 length:378 start_codon:yes stop_codon:yes gene_type:complete